MSVRVRVERVVDARRRLVECAGALGRVQLVWEGPTLPTAGDHDVELDVPSILAWGREIRPAGHGQPPGGAGQAVLTGTLLGVDEAGVAEIEVRTGLLLVETMGEAPLGTVGATVELRAPHIHAYPVDL